VLYGLIPSMPNETALYIAIGIIGATVMPHNLYLHSSLVQTRKFDRTTEGIKQALKYNFIDSTIALNLAFVNAAILILQPHFIKLECMKLLKFRMRISFSTIIRD
jgi:manganese transport protein